MKGYRFPEIDLETAILFEWFIIKMTSFKFLEFFYSINRITKETGIKRRRIERIIKWFQEENVVIVTIKGVPKVTHFKVNIHQIATHQFVKKMYKNEAAISMIQHFTEYSYEADRVRQHAEQYDYDQEYLEKYLPINKTRRNSNEMLY